MATTTPRRGERSHAARLRSFSKAARIAWRQQQSYVCLLPFCGPNQWKRLAVWLLVLPSSHPGTAVHKGLRGSSAGCTKQDQPNSSPNWHTAVPVSLAAGSHLTTTREVTQHSSLPSVALHLLHPFNLGEESKIRTCPHSSHAINLWEYLLNKSCCTEVSDSDCAAKDLAASQTCLLITLERQSANSLTLRQLHGT